MVQINLMPSELEKLAARAKAQGYSTVEEWLRALADEDDEETPTQIIDDFKASWREMKRGEFLTMEELEQYLENDEDD